MAATAHCPRAVRTVLFGVLVAVPAVHAADTLQTARSTAVTVTARRPLEERSIATATVVDMERFQDRKVTMAEVLAEQPGVQVRQLGGFGSYSTVSIRGASAENTRVYLDGVLLNQAIGGAVDLSTIPMDNIDQIEIYRGILPAGMAGSGMGGVVNIKTKSARKGRYISLKGVYGSFNTYTLNSRVSYRSTTNALSVSVSGEGSDNDFVYWGEHPITGLKKYFTRQNAGYTHLSTQLKASHRRDCGKFALNFTYSGSQKGVPGNINSVPSIQSEYEQDLFLSSFDFIPKNLGRVPGSWKFSFFNSYRHSNFLDTLFKIIEDVPMDAEVFLTEMDTDNTNIASGSALHVHFLPSTWLKLRSDVMYSYESFSVDNRIDALDELLPMYRHLLEFNITSDVSDNADKFGCTASLNGSVVKASYIGLKHYELVNTRRTVDASFFGGSAGIVIRPSRAWSLRTNIGRFYRIPSTFELFGNTGHYLGNTDLEAETGYSIDVGTRFTGAYMTTAASVFYTTYNNLIAEMTNSQHVVRPENFGKADNRGIECEYTLHALQWLRAFGNCTWQLPYNRFGNYDGFLVPNMPTLELFLHSGIVLRQINTELYHEFYFLNKNYTDGRNKELRPERYLHTAGLRYEIPKKNLTFNAEVRNILQQKSRDLMDVYGYPLPGRSCFLTIRYGA